MLEGDCESPGKQAYYDHSVTNSTENDFTSSFHRRGAIVGQHQNTAKHNSAGSIRQGSESEIPLLTMSGFRKLELATKVLPPSADLAGMDENNVVSCGKRSRGIFETPSSRVSYMGRPTTMPIPPPLKPVFKEESTDLHGFDDFVLLLPLLGELEVKGNQRLDDITFARKLEVKTTQFLASSPRSVNSGLNLWR
jgi:hypothetical protein